MTTTTKHDTTLDRRLIFPVTFTKPKEDRLLYAIRMDTRPSVRTYYNQHEKELLNILKDVQSLGLVNAYHPLEIESLAAAAVKHYL